MRRLLVVAMGGILALAAVSAVADGVARMRPAALMPAGVRQTASPLVTPRIQAGTAAAAATTPSGGPALSPRNASYTIEVSLDPGDHTLTGHEVLTWRNIREASTSSMPFHLYWNGFRNNQSTWMREDRLRGRSDLGDEVRAGDWGAIDVDTVTLLRAAGDVDLTDTLRFTAEDDGNSHDRTVMEVTLPGPVRPGEEVRVEITWHGRIPRTFARTGRRGDFYFIAQWFPKVGVWEGNSWDCHQFHAATEFFSDYGNYDVSITVPEEYVVGATGVEIASVANPDGTLTHRYVQHDVHDFAWTTSRDYQVKDALFEEPGLPPVKMHLLLQPEHASQADRMFAAARASLKYYGTWFGPYPYDHVTLIDPAYGSGAGGMEYPTLFTCGTRLFNPFGGDSPESVTVHEAGHQFWYGVVGDNEFEHAWLDEGLNTFSTIRTLDAAFGPRILMRRFLMPPGPGRRRSGMLPLRYPDIEVPRFEGRLARYRLAADSDVEATPTYLYHPKTAGDITYSKTALWLETLSRHLGWDTVQEILSTFYQRHAFKHPTPEEFIAVAEEVSGEDLDWFFDQVYFGSAVFDYAVDSADSLPTAPRGLVARDGKLEVAEPDDDEATSWRTEVVVRRHGDGVFPVDVMMVFEDGARIREKWDGRATWKMFTVERASRLAHAVVDPDHVLMLDIDVTNNSRSREPPSRLAARKWASKWMIWFQDLMTTFAFFV
ncbi:MAG: M1 family metallopeptidase [Acidobacteriota bacterium]